MPKQSASQTVGPFFHPALVVERCNILTTPETHGEQIRIEGRLLDGDGVPIEDGLIEIWQADARGRFNHPADPDRAEADPHFHGFGRAETVADGRFSFDTIKPGVIPEQVVPFINVRVFARGMLTHAVTRIYFGDEAANDKDPLLQTVPADRRKTLLATPLPGDSTTIYRFDIRLQGVDETVFIDV